MQKNRPTRSLLPDSSQSISRSDVLGADPLAQLELGAAQQGIRGLTLLR